MITYKYYSYSTGAFCTATLSSVEYDQLKSRYDSLSENSKRNFCTLDDFIITFLSFNA
jgi:hypothetical protein